MMRCSDVELLLAPFGADELEADTAAEVAGHLAACDACRRELVTEMALRRQLGALPQRNCPDAVGRLPGTSAGTRTLRIRPAGHTRLRQRAVAAALGLAAILAVAAILPGRLTETPTPVVLQPDAAEFSPEEIAEARRQVIFSLSLAARILDRSGRQTMNNVFSDRLPDAVSNSLWRPGAHTQGG